MRLMRQRLSCRQWVMLLALPWFSVGNMSCFSLFSPCSDPIGPGQDASIGTAQSDDLSSPASASSIKASKYLAMVVYPSMLSVHPVPPVKLTPVDLTTEARRFPYVEYYLGHGANLNYRSDDGLSILETMLSVGSEQSAIYAVDHSCIPITDRTLAKSVAIARTKQQYAFLIHVSHRIRYLFGVNWIDLTDDIVESVLGQAESSLYETEARDDTKIVESVKAPWQLIF